MKTKISLLTLSLIVLFSCKKENTLNSNGAPFSANATSGVYVSCEGQFTSGNAALTYYQGGGLQSIKDIYKEVNDRNLGDVAQGLSRIGNNLYIVVNNSHRIEICDMSTMERLGYIDNLPSPRYIIPVSSTKAYVSNFSGNEISRVNLSTHGLMSPIHLQGSTEQMLLYNNYVYVTNMSTSYLYKINPTTDIIVDSLLIGFGGNSIVLDQNNKIWVLCGGDYINNITSSLHRVDPVTFTDELTLTFPPQIYLNRLAINGDGDELYYLNTDIYKMSINDVALPTTPFVTANGKNFYSLGYNNNTHHLYAGDAVDFQQSGHCYLYDATGTVKGDFPTGINPGNFLFIGN